MIGLAYGPGLEKFVAAHPGAIDYVELPFELLRHNPKSVKAEAIAPIVLHCASMSIAGFVPPSDETLEQIGAWAARTETPWIGEHLAFISADPLHRNGAALHDATTLSYTVCPQLSEEVLTSAVARHADLQARFDMPIIVENSPQYFRLPGSTMSIVDFTIEFHRRSGAGMLLDLTHFMISAKNVGFDPKREIRRLPLDKVVEIHVSGFDEQEGTLWDDHAGIADEGVLQLLDIALAESAPRAVTFEYNWSPELPDEVLLEQFDRARGAMADA